jgi:hypothetical protein
VLDILRLHLVAFPRQNELYCNGRATMQFDLFVLVLKSGSLSDDEIETKHNTGNSNQTHATSPCIDPLCMAERSVVASDLYKER